MTCIVCHRSVGTRAKKCPNCGAPTVVSKGEFLFKMNSADEKQLKKYYDQVQTAQIQEPQTSSNSSTRSGSVNGTATPSRSNIATSTTSVTRNTNHRYTPTAIEFVVDNSYTIMSWLAWISLACAFILFGKSNMVPPVIFLILAGITAFLIYKNLPDPYTQKTPIVIFWTAISLLAICAFVFYRIGISVPKDIVSARVESTITNVTYSVSVNGGDVKSFLTNLLQIQLFSDFGAMFVSLFALNLAAKKHFMNDSAVIFVITGVLLIVATCLTMYYRGWNSLYFGQLEQYIETLT